MNPAFDPSACRIERYDAAGIADVGAVQRVSVSPGSLLVERRGTQTRVIAVGAPDDVDTHPANIVARREALAEAVLVPALVNAHAHLDLTDIGPLSPENGFDRFIDLVRKQRPRTMEAIEAAVRHGAEMALAGGTAAIGDIAGAVDGRPRLDAWYALARTSLRGVSYLEFFAIGRGEERGLAAVRSELDTTTRSGSAVRLGLQPHAPYSVSRAGYRWVGEYATRHGMPVCTHLSESPEERSLVSEAGGPIRAFLERIGMWDDGLSAEFGLGRSPVAHLGPVLSSGLMAVHVNDASDADIETLARAGTSVVYCPRASAYFGAERVFGPHRYRDMLRAGIDVALGTDSIINLWDGDRRADCLSVLDEMRLLYRRDGTPAETLLAMGTLHGARALGLDPAAFTLAPGAVVAGILSIDVVETPPDRPPLERVLRSAAPVRWVAGPA